MYYKPLALYGTVLPRSNRAISDLLHSHSTSSILVRYFKKKTTYSLEAMLNPIFVAFLTRFSSIISPQKWPENIFHNDTRGESNFGLFNAHTVHLTIN